jgi:hypothetical protein
VCASPPCCTDNGFCYRSGQGLAGGAGCSFPSSLCLLLILTNVPLTRPTPITNHHHHHHSNLSSSVCNNNNNPQNTAPINYLRIDICHSYPGGQIEQTSVDCCFRGAHLHLRHWKHEALAYHRYQSQPEW